MSFLIEHQYVVLYLSGACFSFFAMLSYVKVSPGVLSSGKALDNPESFFNDFESPDLDAILNGDFEDDDEPSKDLSSDARSEEVTSIHSGRGELYEDQ